MMRRWGQAQHSKKTWNGFSYGQYMKMTSDEHVLRFNLATFQYTDGFRCYGILERNSFLLKQIWIGNDDFLLNFFATLGSILRLRITITFGSVLGLQIPVELQVKTGLQPPTRWKPFVAGAMLSHPEPTKEVERVEPTILSIIAIEITHLTRFALLLLLRILR